MNTEALSALAEQPFPAIFLDFRSEDRFLYRIKDLKELPVHLPEELIERIDKCHIYFVCKRPRLSIVPDSVHWDDHSVRLRVFCEVKGVRYEAGCIIKRHAGLKEATAFTSSQFPYRELRAERADGSLIEEMLLANYAHIIPQLPPFARQLEVLYIGKGLSKNTQDRLKSHSTVQKVLADINANDPEAEVFALVYRFIYKRSAMGIIDDADIAHNTLKSRLKPYKPPIDDQVSLIEAACISHFQTDRYNTHYLDFPATDSESSARARAAGADFVVVQIDNENIGGLQTYSQKVSAAVTHFAVCDIRR